MRKNVLLLTAISLMVLGACQTIAPDRTKTNLKYSISDFSTISNDRAVLVVANKAAGLKLAEAKLDKGSFGTKYRVNNSIHEAQVSKFKFIDGVVDGFKIGHLPAGEYVHVSSENARFFKNSKSYTQIVQCQNAGTKVMKLEAGKFYFLTVNDQRHQNFETQKAHSMSKTESLNFLNDYVGSKLGKRVTFESPETVGKVTFKGGKKGPALGFVGQKSIACPDGNDFQFTPL